MKFIYIVNARIPTEKAHGWQICKMCEEFSNLGADVELFAAKRNNPIKDDLYNFYGVKNNFNFREIECGNFLNCEKWIGKYGFYLQSLSFLQKLLCLKIDKSAIIYSRNPEIIWLFSLRGFKTFYDAHSWPENKNRFFSLFLKNANGIVCNSQGTSLEYRKHGFKNILTVSNAVDIENFFVKEKKDNLKNKFNLPMNKKLAIYIGNLFKWKGIAVLIEAAAKIKNEDIAFVIIGGNEDDLNKYKNRALELKLKNIKFFPFQRRNLVPMFLKCADVLLLPNLSDTKESVNYTSPIKMFEYMASQKPIIASDLPSIREILNDSNCLFVEPGNADDLIEKLNLIMADYNLARKLASHAYEDVKNCAWNKRAEKIIKFINNSQ
ncbi:MAG: glycosyltransferase family 4 protein [bacterium]